MKTYTTPVVVTQGGVATMTLASLCVGKQAGGSDNALNPSQPPAQNGDQATPVFGAGPDGKCFTADDVH